MKYIDALKDVHKAKTYVKDLLDEIEMIEKILDVKGANKRHFYINKSRLWRKRILAQEKVLIMEASVSYIHPYTEETNDK
jgi:hypothetical protein